MALTKTCDPSPLPNRLRRAFLAAFCAAAALPLALPVAAPFASAAQAQQSDIPPAFTAPTAGRDYVKRESMIPMRDGVKLHAVILKPADISVPLPFLIQRTPYGVDGTSLASFSYSRPELARDGYIYVGEDIRGRFKSEGKFIIQTPGTPSPGCSRMSMETMAALD